MKNFTRVANKHFGSTKEAVKEPTTRYKEWSKEQVKP
ncbi:hypothetical protein T4D_8045 [Trichinella pseudospiralis]|uniref:Uncharacterized protein n=1 Tax=Trichinella pseudospiralis TaxID=6337 RepID=A0A0V1FKD6_TRIPS|nr:hypothetical protein T4D_8045 [Trichinella pseudospiralis]